MKRILFFATVMSLASCRNLPDFDDLTYKAIVVTNHDANAKWSTYHTYYLPSNIASIGDDPLDSLMDNATAQPILNSIDQNMQARGYVKELNPLMADLSLTVIAIKVTNVEYMYSGWWYGYYGWYYPYYPYYPYSYTYTYTTGSMVIDMMDVKNVQPGDTKANVIWTNFDNGVLEFTTGTVLAVDAVNQAFKQSTYIQTN